MQKHFDAVRLNITYCITSPYKYIYIYIICVYIYIYICIYGLVPLIQSSKLVKTKSITDVVTGKFYEHFVLPFPYSLVRGGVIYVIYAPRCTNFISLLVLLLLFITFM